MSSFENPELHEDFEAEHELREAAEAKREHELLANTREEAARGVGETELEDIGYTDVPDIEAEKDATEPAIPEKELSEKTQTKVEEQASQSARRLMDNPIEMPSREAGHNSPQLTEHTASELQAIRDSHTDEENEKAHEEIDKIRRQLPPKE